MSIKPKITDIQVLKAYKNYTDGGFPNFDKRVDDTLIKETGLSEKEVYSAMNRVCKKELIEYGVSLRCGWLTEKGKQVLSAYELSAPTSPDGHNKATKE